MQSTLFKLFLITSTTLLFACSTPVKHVIVNPELLTVSTNAFQQKQAQISFTDLRRANHIVQILRTNAAAELYSPQQPLVDIIKKSLSAGFKINGLQLQPLASKQIEVVIDNALISVQQELVKYTANNEITLRVIAKNSNKTLTKSFKISGNSNGPFSADIAVLERDFNQQLAKLLNQITQNRELRAFLNE
jgi:uncharacterized lipoprotein